MQRKLPRCVGCGCEIERGTGYRYSRCGQCAWQYRQEYNLLGRPLSRCTRCNGPLPPKHSKFCSVECRYPPTGKQVNCMICGSTFTRNGQRTAKCCSPECTLEAKRERYRRKNRARRLKRKPGTYTLHQIAERDGKRCHLCGRKVDMRLSGMRPDGPSIDHLIPLSAGGGDTPENVALAHRQCNVDRNVGGEVQLRLVG